jgi:hypothetical protein
MNLTRLLILGLALMGSGCIGPAYDDGFDKRRGIPTLNPVNTLMFRALESKGLDKLRYAPTFEVEVLKLGRSHLPPAPSGWDYSELLARADRALVPRVLELVRSRPVLLNRPGGCRASSGEVFDERGDDMPTPLDFAAKLGLERVFLALLAHGAKIDGARYTPTTMWALGGKPRVLSTMRAHRTNNLSWSIRLEPYEAYADLCEQYYEGLAKIAKSLAEHPRGPDEVCTPAPGYAGLEQRLESIREEVAAARRGLEGMWRPELGACAALALGAGGKWSDEAIFRTVLNLELATASLLLAHGADPNVISDREATMRVLNWLQSYRVVTTEGPRMVGHDRTYEKNPALRARARKLLKAYGGRALTEAERDTAFEKWSRALEQKRAEREEALAAERRRRAEETRRQRAKARRERYVRSHNESAARYRAIEQQLNAGRASGGAWGSSSSAPSQGRVKQIDTHSCWLPDGKGGWRSAHADGKPCRKSSSPSSSTPPRARRGHQE